MPSGVDLLFFMGGMGQPPKPIDDIYLPEVKDDYTSLPFKTRAICRYAVDRRYNFVYICDTDTYVIPEKLLKCGFKDYDYYGLIQRPLGKIFQYDAISREGKHHPSEYFPWASGGWGYFLSRKLANIIAHVEPDHWAEDLWVGQIANEQYNHGRVTIGDAKNLAGQCSWHFPQLQFNSGYDLKFGWQERMYKEHQ